MPNKTNSTIYIRLNSLTNNSTPSIILGLETALRRLTFNKIIKTLSKSVKYLPLLAPFRYITFAMAGTSGCIPDHNVNFFGCLCVPRRSAIETSESEPEINIEDHVIEPPTPLRTAVHAAKPDRIGDLFAANQKLIRSYSPADIEIFQATVKENFAEVRRDRANAFAEPPEEHLRTERDHVGHIHEDQAGTQDSSRAQGQSRCLDRNENQTKAELCATQHSKQHAERNHAHYQSPNPPQYPAHRFIITPYSKDHSRDKAPRQTPRQHGEITMFGVELHVEDCEIDSAELRWLDALLLAYFTGDPERRFGFDRVRCGGR